MDEDPRTPGPSVESGSPQAIEAEIEQTREQLGDTVEALAAKTDVKAQARHKVDEFKDNVRSKAESVKSAAPDGAQDGGQRVVDRVRSNPAPFVLGGAVALAFLIGRRSGRRGR